MPSTDTIAECRRSRSSPRGRRRRRGPSGLRSFRITRGAGDRAAGADAGDEVRDRSARLFPDLRPGRVVVRFGIELVVKLIRLEGAGNLGRETIGDAVVRFGRVGRHVRRRDHDVGAVGAQQIDLFLRHLVGHHENAAVAANRRGHRQARAGVAAGRFDDGAAGLEQSLAFGGVEHRDGGPILDAAARIHVFDLREHETVGAVDDLVQLNERAYGRSLRARCRSRPDRPRRATERWSP